MSKIYTAIKNTRFIVYFLRQLAKAVCAYIYKITKRNGQPLIFATDLQSEIYVLTNKMHVVCASKVGHQLHLTLYKPIWVNQFGFSNIVHNTLIYY